MDTSYPTGHPLAVKAWAKVLLLEALKQTYVSRFMGESENSLIQVMTDFKKSAGDQITFGLAMQLLGRGVVDDNTLEGNEEALVTYSDKLLINQLRHAVRSTGKMSEQRVLFSFRDVSKSRLADWLADRWDTSFFNQVCGNTAQTDTAYTGNNAVIAPTAGNYAFPTGQTTEAGVNGSTAAILTLTQIDFAVQKARLQTPLMRPVKVNGEDKYVLFIHPYQATQLRTNTNSGQWLDIQKAAMTGGQVSNNPIYTGAMAEYNGTIIHVSNRIPLAPGTTNVRRAVFCGAQAAVLAFGGDGGTDNATWNEQTFDYGNKLGIEVGTIYGLKKSVFNSQDFASIILPSYSPEA